MAAGAGDAKPTKAAADMLAAVRLGGDPAQEKVERRASMTVGQLIDLFDAQYVGPMLKPGTTVSHRIALEELRGSEGLNDLKVELYRRDATCVTVFLLTLIGAIVAGRKGEERRGAAA